MIHTLKIPQWYFSQGTLLMVYNYRPQTPVEDIVECVCEHYSITHADLISKSRRVPMPDARCVVAVIMYRRGLRPCDVSVVLNVDDSTASWYKSKAAKLLDTDRNFRAHLASVEYKLK